MLMYYIKTYYLPYLHVKMSSGRLEAEVNMELCWQDYLDYQRNRIEIVDVIGKIVKKFVDTYGASIDPSTTTTLASLTMDKGVVKNFMAFLTSAMATSRHFGACQWPGHIQLLVQDASSTTSTQMLFGDEFVGSFGPQALELHYRFSCWLIGTTKDDVISDGPQIPLIAHPGTVPPGLILSSHRALHS
ncbi:hypothetical protein NLJ89_g3898 [Agrocybe chaxingu]|uniref:Uncharacterized protein n=1 Tax=Agrocybe chaxingu TaxID=84603 RepID=A0A9W8K3W4_9AGAR|nr:hypothetical protein NLJ89_g3898 [Agrocybe chaxingu]